MQAFLAFYIPFQIPRLARLPLLTPRTITYDQSLPAKKLAFSTLRPESLTHPGCELPSPVRSQRVPPGHPRAQRGLPVRHGNSETTVGRRREPPGQTALPFQPPARRGLPVRHGDSEITVGRRREPPDRKLFFSILRPARPTQPRCRLTARPSDHLTLTFYLNPSDSGSPDLPTDANESSPAQTISSFQVHARQGLPVRHGDPETTVRHRREPPSQTILLFQVLSSARLTRPTRRLLKPPLDVGESLPARQTLFPSARTTNPVERYIPGRSGNLSFQSTTGEVQPPDSQVSISRRMPQEPPGWTTSPIPPTSAKLTHQTFPSSPVRHSES